MHARADDTVRELTILLGGQIAGTLMRSRKRLEYVLDYENSWRNHAEAYPVSLSLPLASATYEGQLVEWYLRGLLPDSESRLNVIASQYGIDPDDLFGLLANIGEDCPGAVQFVRPDRLTELTGGGRGRIDWLDEGELAALLRGLESESEGLTAGLDVGRFSLPGALAKIALARDAQDKRWGRPHGRAPSTHILKPPLRGVKFHNENEHLCLELARASGLSCASSRVIHVEDQSAIAVERYDRLRRDASVARIHQQDCSQALGANPRLKYSGEGTPGIAEIVGLLRDYSSAGLDDVYAFLKAVAFNWIIGGTDAHPRNYSIMIGAGGNVRLAPLYDLASALFLETHTKFPDLPFPMLIAGRKRIGSIDAAAWKDLGKELRLNESRLLDEIVQLTSRVKEVVKTVADAGESDGLDARFCGRFSSRIRARASECLVLLTK